MRNRALIGVAASIVGAFIAFAMVSTASAAPPGAATNLSFGSQVCQSNGTVSGTLSWNSSGLGSQYVDLAVDAGFNNYSRGGPYVSSANSVSLTQLQPGATYYLRVLTAAGGGWVSSDIAVITASCSGGGGGGTGPIGEPYNLSAYAVNASTISVDWTPGANNIWYCVDTAQSLGDLYNLRNTWRNHGCWTTNSAMTITGLQCGTTYYYLVYAWNTTSNVKSDAAVVQTASCQSTISRPTNLNTTLLEGGEVLFDWNAGQGNIWYCVDTAESQSDLENLTGTWRNHGCWNTNSQLVVDGLDCDETYYWLVYAWNYNANIKSNVATFESNDCKGEAHLEEAPIVDVDVVRTSGGAYRADIIAAEPNGCHSYDSHLVQRQGDTIYITVWNNVEPGPCTFVYSEYELNINLGTNFEEGETYRVIVNDDESDTFTPPDED